MEGYERYVGQTLDNRYRIDKIIGVGGMAVVFRAFDILAGRNVAVKILKDDIARDEVSVKRFINESKAVSMLSHPNIVTIYDGFRPFGREIYRDGIYRGHYPEKLYAQEG